MNANVTKEHCDLTHGVASESRVMKGDIHVTEKLTPGALKCHLQLSTSAGDQLYFRDSVCPVLGNCFAWPYLSSVNRVSGLCSVCKCVWGWGVHHMEDAIPRTKKHSSIAHRAINNYLENTSF